jgi:hypothetical protein
MARFNRPLTVTKIDRDLWVVEISFRFYSDKFSHVDVPDGTLTDFASVPAIFTPIIPRDGDWTQAAVMHDYLYKSHIRSRAEADKLFLEAMEALKVTSWKRYLMYYSVRLFGLSSWKECGSSHSRK